MTPAALLAVLDDAIAATPRRPRRGIALELRCPGGWVLGQQGRHLGVEDGGPVYGFTRHQCEQMRSLILKAAAADAHTPGHDPAPALDYTGDVGG